jgi:PAS domain S-box-containing protein
VQKKAQGVIAKVKKPVYNAGKIRVAGIDIEWAVKNGTCTFQGLPVAMMWVDTTLAGLMSGVQAMVGTKRFALALQSEGRKSIDADWKVISQYRTFMEGFKAISNIAAVAGWGEWRLVSIDEHEKTCVFRAKNSWEGRYQKALGVCWGSGMLAGKLSGYCSRLFQTNCWADQTVFMAKGDAFDEFIVTSSSRSIEKEMQNLLRDDNTTRADMAVALRKLENEIAERKKTEKELRRKTEELKSVFRASPTGIGLVSSPDRIILQVNKKLCEMVGYAEEELIGKNARILYQSEEEYEKVGKEKYQMIQKYGTGTVETRWKRKDSSILDILLSSSPIDSNDLSLGVTFTALDITNRKRADEEIKKRVIELEDFYEMAVGRELRMKQLKEEIEELREEIERYKKL